MRKKEEIPAAASPTHSPAAPLDERHDISSGVEAVLRGSGRLTEAIINFLPDPTLVVNTEGVVIAWNRAAEEMTGIRAEEMLGKGDYEYAIPIYGERRPLLIDLVLKPEPEVEKTYPNLERRGKTIAGENFCPAVKGVGAYLRATASPLFDQEGNLIGAIESFRDATETRRIEEELNRIKKAVESSSSAIWMTDIIGRNIIYHNQSFEKLFDYNAEEINSIGGSPALFSSADEARRVFRKLSRGHSWSGEVKLKNRKSEEIPISLYGDMVRDETGKPIAFMGIGTDITEQKRTESALLESRQRLADIIEFLPDPTMVIDQEGRVIAWNRAIEEMTGVPAEEMLGKGDYEYAIPFYGYRRPILIDLVLMPSEEVEKDYVFIKRESNVLIAETPTPSVKGKEAVLWGKANILYDTHGNVVGAIESIRDITERKRDEEALRETQQRMADIINFLPDATLVIDLEGKVISWNKAAEEMTGIKAEDMIGRGDYEYAIPFYGRRQPIIIDLVLKSADELERNYPFIERAGNSLIGENYCPAVRGMGAYLRATASPLYDSHGRIVGAIESIRDATESKKAEEQMKYFSLHDSLTGLYNRTFFEEQMHLMQHSRLDVSVNIIVCDIDGLKLVNDTFGHESGDKLLRAAAKVIRGCFRESDVVARVGGDEFTVILTGIDEPALEDAINRLRERVDQYNQVNTELPLSVSIGSAHSSEAGANIYDLYKQADNNMYREKLRRKQSVRSSIVQTLMKALETRDFITKGHAERLQNLAVALAEKIGLTQQKINDLILLAQFHDIGKVGVADRILFKPGPLTYEEKIEMQRHCEMGYHIALSAPELAPIADWILKHQEWWNGQGYPLGLKEEEIPLECRIIAIVDAYDAMTSDRPYRKALSHEKAVNELKNCSGSQFDPALIDSFLCILEDFKNV